MPRPKLTKMTTQPAVRYVGRDGEASMNTNDKAPEFTLPDENGKDVSLRDFRGKNVVLFFFPKADTPG
jgi:peroxiredoxin